jgi:DNA-binding protein HU-beta
MNKGELVAALAAKLPTTQVDAKNIIETLSDVIETALLAGDEVTLPGVGKLKVFNRPGRAGRNPKSGEAIVIPEKRVVKFNPGAAFKDKVSPIPA